MCQWHKCFDKNVSAAIFFKKRANILECLNNPFNKVALRICKFLWKYFLPNLHQPSSTLMCPNCYVNHHNGHNWPLFTFIRWGWTSMCASPHVVWLSAVTKLGKLYQVFLLTMTYQVLSCWPNLTCLMKLVKWKPWCP